MKTKYYSLGALLVVGAFAVNCGDDTGSGGSGGEPGTTSATTGSGTTKSSAAVTVTSVASSSSTGMGGSADVACVDVTDPDLECPMPNAQLCECAGCMLPECATDEGFNDCVCANCATDSFCSNPANCNMDAVCDPYNEGCVCPDCAEHPSCLAQVEDCENGMDDNGNGDVDCDDAYCANEPVCVQPACDDATAIVEGDTTGDNTAGTDLINSSCQMAGGKEVVYTYTPTADGFLTITLNSAADLGVHVRTDCADSMTQVACADAQGGGTAEVATVPVTNAMPITIIVDGYTPTDVGMYTINLVFTAEGGCLDNMICSAAAGEACTCADCAMSPTCGFCDATPNDCSAQNDACTCPDCDADMFCTDPANCTDDGFCDQFIEGCQCADCTAVPNCQ